MSLVLENPSLNRLLYYYRQQSSFLRRELDRDPEAWEVYQRDFNSEVDRLFWQITSYEQEALSCGRAQDAERMKTFFARNLRKHFYYGELSRASIDKPFGYSGDFQVIDRIYSNNPVTAGYDRLFDNYFLTSAISVAVRNRKNDFKNELKAFIDSRPGERLRVMSLACGPAREILELLEENPAVARRVHFDCYDMEPAALEHAARMLHKWPNVSFVRANAIRMASCRDISRYLPKHYDFIYSTGLFDYLDFRVSVRLVAGLRSRLNEQGALFISDVRERYANPSVCYMEWAGGWDLLYRSDDEFQDIFKQAGFSVSGLERRYEQQGILQYVKARL